MNTLLKPLITEKSLRLVSKGWYTFATDRFARKNDITSAVKSLFHVDVTEIRTIVMKGKTRRVGKKMMHVKKSDWKKTMIRLKTGQTIDAFEMTESTQSTV